MFFALQNDSGLFKCEIASFHDNELDHQKLERRPDIVGDVVPLLSVGDTNQVDLTTEDARNCHISIYRTRYRVHRSKGKISMQ